MDNLKTLREAAGLTQSELGERTGIHWTTLSRYESGLRPTASARKRLVSALLVALTEAEERASKARELLEVA